MTSIRVGLIAATLQALGIYVALAAPVEDAHLSERVVRFAKAVQREGRVIGSNGVTVPGVVDGGSDEATLLGVLSRVADGGNGFVQRSSDCWAVIADARQNGVFLTRRDDGWTLAAWHQPEIADLLGLLDLLFSVQSMVESFYVEYDEYPETLNDAYGLLPGKMRGDYEDNADEHGWTLLLLATGEVEVTDPWGQPVVYQSRPDGYSLTSNGPDSRLGTSDDWRTESGVIHYPAACSSE